MTDTTDTIVDLTVTGGDGKPIRLSLPCDPRTIRELTREHGPLTIAAVDQHIPDGPFRIEWLQGQDPTPVNLLAHTISQSDDPIIGEKLDAVLDAALFPPDEHAPLKLANIALQADDLDWHDYTRRGGDRYERYGRTLIDLALVDNEIYTFANGPWGDCLDVGKLARELQQASTPAVILTPHGWLDPDRLLADENLYTASQLAVQLGLDTDDED